MNWKYCLHKIHVFLLKRIIRKLRRYINSTLCLVKVFRNFRSSWCIQWCVYIYFTTENHHHHFHQPIIKFGEKSVLMNTNYSWIQCLTESHKWHIKTNVVKNDDMTKSCWSSILIQWYHHHFRTYFSQVNKKLWYGRQQQHSQCSCPSPL